MKTKLANWEIAVYVLHMLGGGTRRVPTEDVAKRCYELAPACFSWVKYPEYPDKDVVRTALVDARKEKHGSLVEGRAGRGKGQPKRTSAAPALDGWGLTEAGAKWIYRNEDRLADDLHWGKDTEQRQLLIRKLAQIREHRLYVVFLQQPEGFSPGMGDMADLFRCRVDAEWRTWEKRFNAVNNMAQIMADCPMMHFIRKCKASVRTQIEIA